MQHSAGVSVSTGAGPALQRLIRQSIARSGGWLPFDRFMALALYAPGLGYYTNAGRKFGMLPQTGSDFVTAPELSPLFGAALARQLAQALAASGTNEIWEFGAGSGALAAQLLGALGDSVVRYTIVDLSGVLRERQQQRLAALASKVRPKVRWVDELPAELSGVIVGNEVLDAMPVQLLRFDGTQWHERGVVIEGEAFAWAERPTTRQPPGDTTFPPGAITETHAQAEAFIATLADRLERGAAFFIDYGFPRTEYHHPQRLEGTLMCHRAHQADTDPLVDVGQKDITAHVDFTGIALAAQDAGLDVIGYTSQAHFLINCGIVDMLNGADVPTSANTQKLLMEHEMGELFKVIGLAKGCDERFMREAIGFLHGDRTHTL
jgi:SAM-dependent MidA family methyltransferase